MYSARTSVAAVLFVALGTLGLSGCLVDSGDGVDEAGDTPSAEMHSKQSVGKINEFDACTLRCMDYRDKCLSTTSGSVDYCEGRFEKCLCSTCGLGKLDPRACDGVRKIDVPIAPLPPLQQK
ncbi:MAG TPA: hypothetical protein PKA88_36610 [Polyangiaceae bacterium]|nr:hypothetical protein [Polyangiaceae bacterium]HMR76255.1 hypothetical protein [Polyangiaceae bacterium]